MKRFLNLVVYILTIHVSALLIAGLFRLVLFISSYHQLTSEALSDKTLPMLAFAHGVWFDNVIGCYILLLPLVVAVVCGVCNYYGKALFRFFTIFFSVFYGLVYLISASDIPYFAYFFKHINSSIFEWFGYAGTTAGMILGESAYYLSIGLFLLFLAGFVVWLIYLARYFHHRSLAISAPFPYWKRGGAVLIGVASKADMLDKDGKLPRIRGALLSDAIGTTVGAMFGTSTVTTFVESASGVAEGGRTGLTSAVAAILFGLSLFLSPIFLAIPSFATAPALIVVGFLMISSILKIDFNDYTEAIPAYIGIIAMPFMYSISEGISLGIISYVVINLVCGKAKEKKISPLLYILAVLFVLKYIML